MRYQYATIDIFETYCVKPIVFANIQFLILMITFSGEIWMKTPSYKYLIKTLYKCSSSVLKVNLFLLYALIFNQKSWWDLLSIQRVFMIWLPWNIKCQKISLKILFWFNITHNFTVVDKISASGGQYLEDMHVKVVQRTVWVLQPTVWFV